MTKISGVNGHRKVTDGLVRSALLAGQKGRPEVVKSTLSMTIKKAQTALGLKGRTAQILDLLLGYLRPEDLKHGSRPVVTLSNRRIGLLVGCGTRTVSRHLKFLVEAGIIAYRDSPTGKRYIKRTKDGKEAYGLDFSPAIWNLEKFAQMTEEFNEAIRLEEVARREAGRVCREIGCLDPDMVIEANKIRAQRDLTWQERCDLLCALVDEVRSKKLSVLEDVDRPVDKAVCDKKQSPVGDKNDAHIDSTTLSQDSLSKHSCVNMKRQSVNSKIGLMLVHNASSRWRSIRGISTLNWKSFASECKLMQRFLGIDDQVVTRSIEQYGGLTVGLSLLVIAEKGLKDARLVKNPAAYFNGMMEKARNGELNLTKSLWGLCFA